MGDSPKATPPTKAQKLAALKRLRFRLLGAIEDGGAANPDAMAQIEREIAELEKPSGKP